jgi:hypothetical protein
MFIRRTSKTVNNKTYTQHQLIESYRNAAGPRQRLVLNLGQLKISENHFKDLANRIEDILNNTPSLFKAPAEVEALAKHFAEIIIQQGLNKNLEKTDKKKDLERIDLNSIVHSQAKTLGGEHIVLEQMKQYHFNGLLKSLGFGNQQIDYAQMLVIGRLLFPGSERRTVRWIEEISATKELLNTEVKVYDNALHRVAVELWENHQAIEKELSQTAKKVFSLKETIILYDLTNTYFEGTKADSELTGFGPSKDRRNDRPLVTLALVVDDQGFPKQSRILPGHPDEPGSLEGMLDQLEDQEQHWISKQKTIVIDAGIASEENLKKIKDRKGMKYVAVSRKKNYDENLWKGKTWEELTLCDDKSILKVKLVKLEDESFLLCESQAKAAKEQGIIDRRTQRFEKELKELNGKLSKKRTKKKYEYIIEKIGRLKERYRLGGYYEIDVQQQDDQATKISFKRTEANEKKRRAIGQYVIRTDRTDLTAEEVSQIHRSLTTVEDSFGSMKSELGLRPNFHHTDEPTAAHIHITVLAYHVACGILKKLQDQGIHYSWRTIREILSTHIRVTTTFNNENDDVIYIRSNTAANAEQSRIYNALGVKHNPLGRRKMKIKDVVRKNEASKK